MYRERERERAFHFVCSHSCFFGLLFFPLRILEFKAFPCEEAGLQQSLATRKQRLAFTPVYHMEPPHFITDRSLFLKLPAAAADSDLPHAKNSQVSSDDSFYDLLPADLVISQRGRGWGVWCGGGPFILLMQSLQNADHSYDVIKRRNTKLVRKAQMGSTRLVQSPAESASLEITTSPPLN